MDPIYAYKKGYMVIMCGKTPCKIGMLAVAPYRFIRYKKKSALVAEVEGKTGTVLKVSSTYLVYLRPSRSRLMTYQLIPLKKMWESTYGYGITNWTT